MRKFEQRHMYTLESTACKIYHSQMTMSRVNIIKIRQNVFSRNAFDIVLSSSRPKSVRRDFAFEITVVEVGATFSRHCPCVNINVLHEVHRILAYTIAIAWMPTCGTEILANNSAKVLQYCSRKYLGSMQIRKDAIKTEYRVKQYCSVSRTR